MPRRVGGRWRGDVEGVTHTLNKVLTNLRTFYFPTPPIQTADSLFLHTMQFQEEVLSGWGNIPHSISQVAYPREEKDITGSLVSDKVIARGLGRSYADQSTNTGHKVLRIEKMNHFLSFDATTGVLE